MLFSLLATAAWDSASSLPETIFPARSRTEYSYVNVAAIACLSASAGQPVEVLDVVALLETGLVGDPALLDEVREVLVHRVHPVLRPGLHGRVDLVGLAFTDQVPDGRRRDQHLGRDHPAVPVRCAGQGLAADALEGAGELDPD